MKYYTFEEWKNTNSELLGKENLDSEMCEECGGHGNIQCEKCYGDGDCSECGAECIDCGGNGNILCEKCYGNGEIDKTKEEYDYQLIIDKRKFRTYTNQ